MEGTLQKRLVRKLDLEILLSQVEPHPIPNPNLEQYTTPPDVAAAILYLAAYSNEDIIGKSVLDLGCGTGRLALGAAFLGAKQVIGIDIDRTAVAIAKKNAVRACLNRRVQWIAGDLDSVVGGFDTVLMNPPFGVQKKTADRRFLIKAIESSHVTYSLHKGPNDLQSLRKLMSGRNWVIQTDPSPFLKHFIESCGGAIKAVYSMLMTIPYMFNFHDKKEHKFIVSLYVIEQVPRNLTSDSNYQRFLGLGKPSCGVSKCSSMSKRCSVFAKDS